MLYYLPDNACITTSEWLNIWCAKNDSENLVATKDRFKQICIVDRLYGHSKGGEKEVGGTMEKRGGGEVEG